MRCLSNGIPFSEKATQEKYGLRTLKMHEQNISQPLLALRLK